MRHPQPIWALNNCFLDRAGVRTKCVQEKVEWGLAADPRLYDTITRNIIADRARRSMASFVEQIVAADVAR